MSIADDVQRDVRAQQRKRDLRLMATVDRSWPGRTLRHQLQAARADVVWLLDQLAIEEARTDSLLQALVIVCNGAKTAPVVKSERTP